MGPLKKYHAMINVEVAASVNIAVCLFKYILKVSDTAQVQLVTEGQAKGN